eukprot:12405400-Karenia_brevis.AAC.1
MPTSITILDAFRIAFYSFSERTWPPEASQLEGGYTSQGFQAWRALGGFLMGRGTQDPILIDF